MAWPSVCDMKNSLSVEWLMAFAREVGSECCGKQAEVEVVAETCCSIIGVGDGR